MIISLYIVGGVGMPKTELEERISKQLHNKPYKLVRCYGIAYQNENYLKVEVKI